VRIGLLDLAAAITETIELAPLADALGFHRYWIAEHQPQPSPTLLVTLVAGLTERIRVGTGGILLHYYVPRRAAHDFHLLQRAFFGRIDAGFVSALGGFPEDLEGRDPTAAMESYAERARELIAHVRNTPASGSFDPESAWPGALDVPPELWSLGGHRAGGIAASAGVCFGYNFMYRTSVDDPGAIAAYRKQFQPHPTQPRPLAALAVSGICADTEADAQRMLAAYENRVVLPRVVGDPPGCARLLRELLARFAADEIIYCDVGPDLAVRQRGLTALARELELDQR
jgi:luciferase family oxidoreductase group 1